MSTHIINLLRVSIILNLCLYLPLISFAQIGTGGIRGRITDPEGVPLPGVTVTIKGPTIAPRISITNENGIYRFLNLPPGTYSITVELDGFENQVKEDIFIQVERTILSDIKLDFRAIEEEITVRAVGPELEIELENKIEEEIEQLSIGQIVFNPSEEMTEHITERIEARISQNINEDLTQGLRGRGIPQVEKIHVSTVMTAKLSGDTFKIKLLSDGEQPVLPSEYAQWEWDVTPQKAGQRKLQLSVSASIYVDGFGERKKSHPVMEKVILVKVNPNIKKPSKIDWYKIIGGIGAFLGAIAALFGIYFGFKQLKLAYRRRRE